MVDAEVNEDIGMIGEELYITDVPIEKRSKVVQKCIRPDNIKVDFMMDNNHKRVLLVMTDRATLHKSLYKLKSRKGEVFSKAIIKTLIK